MPLKSSFCRDDRICRSRSVNVVRCWSVGVRDCPGSCMHVENVATGRRTPLGGGNARNYLWSCCVGTYSASVSALRTQPPCAKLEQHCVPFPLPLCCLPAVLPAGSRRRRIPPLPLRLRLSTGELVVCCSTVLWQASQACACVSAECPQTAGKYGQKHRIWRMCMPPDDGHVPVH